MLTLRMPPFRNSIQKSAKVVLEGVAAPDPAMLAPAYDMIAVVAPGFSV